MLHVYQILACIVIGKHFQVCQALASEHAVYDVISNGYNKKIRPVRDVNTRTFVEISPQWLTVFGMVGYLHNQFQSFTESFGHPEILQDPAMETVSFNTDFTMTWKDEFLHWNPSDFGGIETISVPEKMLWLPDICMVSSYESTPLIPEERRKARITYDGNVTIWNPQIVTHYCGMKIDNFPFDSQTCIVILSPWTLTINTTIATTFPVSFDEISTSFEGNPEWLMISFGTNNSNITISSETYSEANMMFTLKRNFVYYICVLMIPTFLMTTLCLLGIFAPFSSTGDREEKVTLGLTTLLAMSVILNSVADDMPKSSKLPLLGWFVIAELAVCAVAILISVLIMFLHQKAFLHHYSPPSLLLSFLRCKVVLCFNDKEKSNQGSCKDDIERARVGERQLEYNKELDNLRDAIVMVRKCIEKHESKVLLHYQWNIIVDRIDIIMLITFQLVNISLSSALLL